MYPWYMKKQNSFREISSKFKLSRFIAFNSIVPSLDSLCKLVKSFIKWPMKQKSTLLRSKEHAVKLQLYQLLIAI